LGYFVPSMNHVGSKSFIHQIFLQKLECAKEDGGRNMVILLLTAFCLPVFDHVVDPAQAGVRLCAGNGKILLAQLWVMML